MPLSVAAATRSACSKFCFLIFFHVFQLNGMKFGVVMKQFKWKILILLLSEIYIIRGFTCCFIDCIRTNVGMLSDI